MIPLNCAWLSVIAGLTLFAWCPLAAEAESYRFKRLVDLRQGFDPKWGLGVPALNNRGEIAFEARRGPLVGMFRTNGRRRTTIAAVHATGEPSDFAFYFGPPSINDRGQVAFWAALEGGEAILRGQGGPLTTIAEAPTGPFEFFIVNVSLNNRGQVAFGADLDNGDDGLFVGRGGAVSTLYVTSGGQFSGDTVPSINNRGQIAFATYREDTDGLFLSRGEKIVPNEDWFLTLTDSSGPLAGFVGVDPSLNDRQAVAFRATDDEGALGIFLATPERLARIADTSPESDFIFLGDPSLNNRGHVAFKGTLGDETGPTAEALFLNKGSSRVKLLGTGDRLDGSRVAGIGFAREGLNDRGQLAFRATLRDGRAGIYLATPRRRRTLGR